MASFEYEWWTVNIKDETGKNTWEFKGKTKESVIRQIKTLVTTTNSKKNVSLDAYHRKPRIIEVYWETLKLDRKGYQRIS